MNIITVLINLAKGLLFFFLFLPLCIYGQGNEKIDMLQSIIDNLDLEIQEMRLQIESDTLSYNRKRKTELATYKLEEQIDGVKKQIEKEFNKNGYYSPILVTNYNKEIEVRLKDRYDAKVIGKVEDSVTVRFIRAYSSHYKIEYNGLIGFVSYRYAKATDPMVTAYLPKGYTLRNTLDELADDLTSGGGSINVKGHYRTSKSGKRYYVRPHTRRRNP